ncbi:conserved protein of unknown function [Methylocella tundrae]|uniref:Uncharacterized protein n=1 Tax=Methylocella tundrae TaxID=227605 RepID=A0A4U8YU08_METTU|nr:conserved protein of unknown function [Methylocella tundrae]
MAQEPNPKAKPGLIMPLPPSRPANLGSPPAAAIPAPVAPPTAAPQPPAPDTAPAAPVQSTTARPHPLPVASRQRMHECGAEWQKMKMDGSARDKTWHDFAEICLAR